MKFTIRNAVESFRIKVNEDLFIEEMSTFHSAKTDNIYQKCYFLHQQCSFELKNDKQNNHFIK